jgi:transposase
MRALYVRDLITEEREILQKSLRSTSAFTMRRCQILLMSSEERLKPGQIAERLRCSDQTVRRALRAFEAEGLGSLEEKSRARHDDQRALDNAGQEWLKERVRQSPRQFGFEGSLWTLEWLAELAAREGLTEQRVTPETVGRALKRAGVNWRRAKHWITSPDEHYASKKNDATG